MNHVRIRLLVSGRVQGVGFRYAAREAASACGVAGWARNLPDGSVEIVAQGSPDAMDRMTAWARRGPPGARVDRVEEERVSVAAEPSGFEIRR